jgi:porphobilinogen deaminase
MVLREGLVDTDIPHRDKMREAIVCHWRKSFEDLKLDLSVS